MDIIDTMGILSMILGLAVIVFAYFSDLIFGKGMIVLGPESIGMMVFGTVIMLRGIVLVRKRGGKDKNRYGYLLFLLLFFHVLVLLYIIPPSEIFNKEPFLTVDYGFHHYQNYAVNEFFKRDWKGWGYDPYFMAGYPMGIIFDLNNKACEIFTCLFSFLGMGIAYKVFILLSYLVLPLALYGAARNFGMERGEGFLAALCGVLFWFMDSSMRWAWFCGMYSFSFVSYFAVYVIALVYRYMEDGGKKNLALIYVLGSIVFLVPTSVFIMGIPLLIFFMIALYNRNYRVNYMMIVWAALLLLSGMVWLFPSVRFAYYKISSAQFLLADLRTFVGDLLFQDGLSPGTGFVKTLFVRWAIIFSGIYGIYLWKKERPPVRYKVFASTALVLFLLAYCGTYFSKTASLQPYRFVLPFTFLLAIPAGKALLYFYRTARKENFKTGPLIVILLLLSLPLMVSGIDRFLSSPRISSTCTENENAVIDWIEKNTDDSARILCEDGGFPTFFPVLAINRVKRQFIGGLYMYTFIRHSFAEFRNPLMGPCRDRLFNRDFPDFSLSTLKEYLDGYNIGWVVVFSDEAKEFFSRFSPHIVLKKKIGNMSAYEVRSTRSFFIKGKGKVTKADYNRIEVKDASAGELILKYHWLETLKTLPPLRMEPVKFLDDPVGFIKVYNKNVSSFTIYNAY